MHLIEISFEEFLYWFLGSAAGLVILYFIIRAAVKAGTNDLKKQLRLLNNLTVMEMEKNGEHAHEKIIEIRDEILNG